MEGERVRPMPQRRILVVDDDEGTRVGLERWFAQDYEVVTAADGLEGLEAARREPHPEVIIADVWMPGLDGFEMVRRIKLEAALKGIPVIFLTGQTSVRSVLGGLAVGARAYLPKPIDLDVLDSKVRSALSRSRSA